MVGLIWALVVLAFLIGLLTSGEERRPRRKQIFDLIKTCVGKITWFLSDPNRALAFLTLFLVLIGVGALCIQRDTENRQLRAYVSFLEVHIKLQDGVFDIGIIIKNSGQSPAYEVTAISHWKIIDESVKTNAVAELCNAEAQGHTDSAVNSRGTVGPQEPFTINKHENFLDTNPPMEPAIRAHMPGLLEIKKYTLFFTGMITYRDAFGNARKTPLCYRLVKVFDGWSLNAADQGNEAN
jgi:hypothetical protein